MKQPLSRSALGSEARSLLRFLGIAGVIGLTLAIGLSIFVRQQGGPWWLQAISFVTPGIIMLGLASQRITAFVQLIKRAAPSPEAMAAEDQLRVTQPDPDPDEADADQPEVEYPEPNKLHSDRYPNVPELSPPAGRELAFNLERAGSSPGVKLVGSIFIATFWNGIVSVFLYRAIWGDGGWFLRIFLIPFVLVGLMLLTVVFYSALDFIVNLLVGPFRVEISSHPLRPRDTILSRLFQNGLFTLQDIRVALECEESATYTQGTSTSTATKIVATHEAEPQTEGYQIQVPSDAMHSFEAKANSINWQLRVTGRVLGILPFNSAYAVLVVPREMPV